MDHIMNTNKIFSLNDIPRNVVNDNSNIPLYTQIYDVFSELIHNGTLVPGDLLPGELAIAEHFGLSRGTVRQAMRFLEENGMVSRRQGKGTIVSDSLSQASDIFQPYEEICNLFCLEKIDRIDVKYEYTGAGSWISQKMNLSKGSLLVMANLCFYSNDTVVAFAQHFIPIGYLEKFKVDTTSEEAMRNFILSSISSCIASSEIDIIPIINDSENVAVLPNIECLMVQETVYDENNQPVAFKKSYLRGDYYRFRVKERYSISERQGI